MNYYKFSFSILFFFIFQYISKTLIKRLFISKPDLSFRNNISRKIPKIMHKTIYVDGMDTPKFNKKMQFAIDSFQKFNPDYTLKIYNGKDMIEYIKLHYSEVELNTFNSLQPYAYKTDFFRMLLLYNEGGFYSDIRSVCLKSFDSIFPSDMEWFSMKDGPQPKRKKAMAINFIASIPKHPWLKNAINLIIKNTKLQYYGCCALCPTGPCMFGKACNLNNRNNKHLIGMHKKDSWGKLFGFTHKNEKFLLYKYKKNFFKKFKGGEFSDMKGNNYGEIYSNKGVYK